VFNIGDLVCHKVVRKNIVKIRVVTATQVKNEYETLIELDSDGGLYYARNYRLVKKGNRQFEFDF
jgi:hypothetical protein